ncbi:MAG: MJ1477/TM1410 family putative glycoside hydrolase [Hyphomicrobiaceae bacterium]
MSISELAIGLGLLVLTFAVGFLKGRSSNSASPKSDPTPLPSRQESVPVPVSPPAKAAPKRAPRRAPVSPNPKPDIAAVQSWGYQLQDLDLKRATASPFDLLVVDYATDGTDDTALKPADLVRLQAKPDGSRRIVLAYLSIGEAESYRFYWRKPWAQQRPGWLLRENPDWDQNYAVCFWDAEWQALLYGSPGAYLDKILAQGFDGIYLDKCDVTEDLRRREKKAAATRSDLDGDMVDLVHRLAEYARARRPGFLVVMQNAEPLLERADLRRDIDAAAKEELLFGLDAAEKPNDHDEIDWARKRLDLVRKDGKPVLIVEYLNNAAKIAQATTTARELGYVLYVADKNRELDKLRTTPLVA